MLQTKAKNYVIPPQGAILEVKALAPFSILEIDSDGLAVSIIQAPTTYFRKKIYGCEEIQVVPESTKTQFEVNIEPSVIKLDTTPIEVPVEDHPRSTADLKAQLMGILEQERRQKHKPTFEEFTDLDMPDGLEDIFQGVGTIYEAEAEALRQHYNPFRGFDLENTNTTPENGSEAVETVPDTAGSTETAEESKQETGS